MGRCRVSTTATDRARRPFVSRSEAFGVGRCQSFRSGTSNRQYSPTEKHAGGRRARDGESEIRDEMMAAYRRGLEEGTSDDHRRFWALFDAPGVAGADGGRSLGIPRMRAREGMVGAWIDRGLSADEMAA